MTTVQWRGSCVTSAALDYVEDVSDVVGSPIVIVPAFDESVSAPPELGGPYVGQRFILTMEWNFGSMQGFDILPLWTSHKVRVQPAQKDAVILWLRQDVYDSNPVSPLNAQS